MSQDDNQATQLDNQTVQLDEPLVPNPEDNQPWVDMWQLIQQPLDPKRIFSDENLFSELDNPFSVAIEFLDKGDVNNGILALEAHLNKNEQDARAWRILGDLHMECDDDELAMECLKTAHKLDPNDLDTLLGLGVYCANQSQKIEAQAHLKNWLINNQKYHDYVSRNDFLSKDDDQNAGSNTIVADEIVKVLREAYNANPDDTDLIMCLAVHHVSAGEYDTALQLFKEAAQLDPENYSFWNKIGAVAFYSSQKEECIKSYTEALAIKPNYVRAWVNMGILHSSAADYENTIKYYLTALSIRPKLTHVWNYIRMIGISWGRTELLDAANSQDLKKLGEEFPYVSADQLPEPKIEYKKLNEKYILKL